MVGVHYREDFVSNGDHDSGCCNDDDYNGNNETKAIYLELSIFPNHEPSVAQ